MPSAVCQKPLKVAESISQLNSMIQVDDKTLSRIKSSAKKSLIDCIETIQQQADKHKNEGDEENAYILYMRAMEICQQCSSPNIKDTRLKDKIKYCLLNSEKLSESLKRRYELLQESKLARESEERASLNQKINGGIDIGMNNFVKKSLKENDRNNHCDTDGRVPNIIQPLDLHSIIEEVKKNSPNHSPILLLDIRTSEDFQNSHMDFKKLLSPNVKLIHVPEEKLESGMAMSKLLKILSLNNQAILKERHKALKVVLFDWTSESIPSSGPLKIVYDCLWKWDSSTEKLLSPPCILKNGYNGWLTTYPIYVSNPKVEPPTKIDFVPCRPQIDNFFYDFFDLRKEMEEKQVPPAGPELQASNQPLNNGTHVEPDEGANQSNSIITRLTSNNNLKDIKSKIPGSAQLVPPINRAMKPKMIINTDKTSSSRIKTNSMTEVKVDDGNHSTSPLSSPSISEIEFKTRKQNEAIEEMNRINIEEGEKDRMAKQYQKQNFDERNRMHERVPSSKNKLSIVNGTKDDEGGIISRKAERTVSESVDISNVPPTLSKTSRSLSRSYSSPNIADHLEDDELEGKENHPDPPVFDRSLKPPALRMNNFSRSTSISARSRNFSPIYGIPGQVNTGLKNLGNTCFMNAVLQCLADTPDLRRYFMKEAHLGEINRNSRLGSKGELALELGALTREIRSNQYKNVSPFDFKESVLTHMPFFVGGEQQDAHEFLCMLLEKLHADLNRAKPKSPNGIINLSDDLPAHIAIKKFWTDHISKNNSIISELFEGLLMSTLKCTVCDKQSNTFEVFMNLSIPIPTRLGHRCTLANCLDLFTDDERLSGEAAWECPSCKTKRDAIKRIRICKLPRILVIHLKRFSYEGKWRQKLQNLVEFPLVDLSLDGYRASTVTGSLDSSYDLYGVVNHNGTLEGGHYVAYCKNEEKGKWFEYDDHEVTELSAADVKSHAAYLLFYTARDVERIH